MTIWIILTVCGYILGAVPASYLAAKLKGIDLRKNGTHQVGGGNLWRMTSWKFGLPVGIFDFCKGAAMMWIAQSQGLDTAQQLVVGLAVIVGHNWPVFLRFHGGRGIATLLGTVLILPAINNLTPRPAIIAIGIVILGFIVLRSSPLPVLIGVISLPLTNWAFHDDTAVTLGFVAIFLIIVIRRLSAPPSAEADTISRNRLLCNRLLFDRDIMDKKAWMYRKSIASREPWED